MSNAEFQGPVTTFSAEFQEFIAYFDGIEKLWISDGSNGETAGHLYALTSNQDIVDCGLASDYAYAKKQGWVTTEAKWNQLIKALTLKGKANGLAELDSAGHVPASQLPSYVDDVLEGYGNPIGPAPDYTPTDFYKTRSGTAPNYTYSDKYTPETDKIYVDKETHKIYRYSGSQYILISRATDVLNDSVGAGNTDYTWTADKLATKFVSANPEFTGSISMGRKANTTVGTGSSAFGDNVEARGNYSHAEGSNTVAQNKAHAEGNASKAIGENSHAEGSTTEASNINAHAEGATTKASGNTSHAEGVTTIASGTAAHSEGQNTTASGSSSHAEGLGSIASEFSSHAEGYNTVASGSSSHAEGKTSEASGYASHAEGEGTVAARRCQHVFGEYNIAETGTAITRGTYVEIVGNGNGMGALHHSNARTLDWSGNERLQGTLYVNETGTSDGKEVATKEYVNQWMHYEPITIDSLTISPATVENGSTVASVTFTYSFSKVPTTVTLDGVTKAISTASGSFTKQVSVSAKKTWTLQVSEEKPDGTSVSASQTVTLNFYNMVFYGVSTTSTLTSGADCTAFARGLTGVLDSNGKVNFSANAGNNNYVWYISTVNTCGFNVGGFDGGFEPPIAIKVKNNNGSGTLVTYYAYRSTNAGIGSISVTVK